MRNLPSTTATPGTGPLAPVYTFATSTGGDPTLLIIAGVVLAGLVLFLLALALDWAGVNRTRLRRRRHEPAVGRAAAEQAMAAAFPQTAPAVRAPAQARREVTVGGRA